MTLAFRPDIEGLRTFAVVPILLFHLDTHLCPGGYIGVDVFFVISGFLITRMIVADGDQFSLRRFYVRRLFRLFPALLAAIAGTLVLGWKILPPDDFSRLAQSAIASSFGLSNFYFLRAVDYFHASATAHPLLHTWSLGVEEQFYLFWPAFLLFARRFGGLAVGISMVGVLSFAAVAGVQSEAPEAAFYLMPFRAFEFAGGAALVLLENRTAAAPHFLRLVAGLIASALLAFALVTLDDATPWPSHLSLVPVLATALFIFAGQGGAWARVLSIAPLRWIGRISYSVYLVHWPIIAVYREFSIVALTVNEIAFLGTCSMALGALLYFSVERPFRISSSRDSASTRFTLLNFRFPHGIAQLLFLLLFVSVLSAAAGIIGAQGFPSRLADAKVEKLDKGLSFGGDICDQRRVRCVFGDRGGSRTVYILGDSHSLNLLHGLDGLFKAHNVKGIALFDHGCLFAYRTSRYLSRGPDKACGQHVQQAYEILASNRDAVIFAGSYAGYRNQIGWIDGKAPLMQTEAEYYDWLHARFVEGLDFIGAKDRRVIFFKQTYTTGVNLPKCLAKLALTAQPNAGEACKANSLERVLADYKEADRLIDLVAGRFPSLKTIDPKYAFCTGESCTTSNHGDLYFRDTEHLTIAGSDFLIDQVKGQLMEGLGLR